MEIYKLQPGTSFWSRKKNIRFKSTDSKKTPGLYLVGEGEHPEYDPESRGVVNFFEVVKVLENGATVVISNHEKVKYNPKNNDKEFSAQVKELQKKCYLAFD
jgi:hypothetical protein